ncbi:MAG: TrkH family potassium uptake protein [Alphaproteobacteria bacterium]|nr:TrkH family potassium uptake protein [Alphaproteobacteria bacterium]
MIDFRPILFIVGILLSTLALAMTLPAMADLLVNNPDWQVFASAAALTLFIGLALILSTRSATRRINLRQAFVLTALCWLVIPTFGALPFTFSALDMHYPDAFFEAMSGVTTTGSTVIVGLDQAPPGILLWRALLQWLGGIGIIAMAITVLPLLQVGGMQLFRMESSDKSEKAMPRTAQLAGWTGVIYLGLTLLCAILYWVAGMSGFDAVAHAMTTIATGGYSTHDNSIGFFGSAWVDTIAVIFMLIGSLPFVLYLRALRGNPGSLWRDEQVRLFLTIVGIAVAVMTLYLHMKNGVEAMAALRLAAFNVVSIITGTGYATTDFGLWGGFAVAALFCMMFIGGCAGSTTCGLKVFRFQVLYAAANIQIRRLLQPNGVFIPYYNRKPISEQVLASVMAFFFLFILCWAALAIGLGFTGLDFLTATSGAASAIANVGPGLGDMIGPAGNFSEVPIAAKWMLSFGMLLGRLELFTILVLLMPSFWRA